MVSRVEVNMALRVVHTVTGENGVTVRVYWNPDWAEYTCIPRVNGVPYRPATYHTDDRQDALDSAAKMAREFIPQ